LCGERKEKISPRYPESTIPGSIGKHKQHPRVDPMYSYYDLYRNSNNPVPCRMDIVQYAKEHGIKPTVREFKATPTTKSQD